MIPFWDRFLREPLRKVLLRVLIITEKKSEKKPMLARKENILHKDIHVPPVLVLAVSAFSLWVVLLFGLGRSYRSAGSLLIYVCLVIALFVFYLKRDFPKLIHDDEAMMLLGTLTILFILIIGSLRRWNLPFYLAPIPAASILSCVLLHPRLSIVLTMILSMVLGMMYDFSFHCFIIGFFGGIAGTAAAFYIRTHRDFIRAGIAVTAVQFFALSVLMMLRGGTMNEFLWGSLWAVSNGFASSVLALGLLPHLESFFSRVTPMKLLELADFNQPLLKRLMVEAPGTYHHSLMMATIAEAAARAIGANELLCRVGAYYHDIGKLVKPEYFIENQGNMGTNPHGNLAPALSSLVVASHVKEGVALARAAKLPAEIVSFIPMHHGTSRIEYFYNQAKEDAEEESLKSYESDSPAEVRVEEQTYRYPGPRPETKETAILMMADSVEAAARTVEEPTHLRFKDLVEKIVQKKFDDGQLSCSPLTLSDLDKIKETFVNTLTSIYHARIEYPEDESN
jgi:putative nucleotidyltransferase with HDIG domain